LGITMHRMPQIGELGPGVWLASGFGGHGLNTTAMAGNIVARAIVEGDPTWRQFTPFELVWAGGVFGRVAAQLRVWIKRLRDSVEERRAKARELAHRQVRQADAAQAVDTPRPSAPHPEPPSAPIPGPPSAPLPEPPSTPLPEVSFIAPPGDDHNAAAPEPPAKPRTRRKKRRPSAQRSADRNVDRGANAK